MEEGLNVAYVVVMFPCYSETFVLRELLELKRRGARLTVLSLKGFSEKILDDDARAILPDTLYSPFLFSLGLLRSNIHFLLRKPGGYAGMAWLIFRNLITRPRELLKNAALFPKSVHFARLIEERGVRHIHAHFANYPATAACIISRLTGIPFTVTAHAHDIFQNQHLLEEKISRADGLFVISEYNRRFITESCGGAPPGRVEVLHCGLDLARLPGPAPRGGGPPRILSVGRMMGIKGFDVLLKALALLRDRRVFFRCMIVGDGPDREALERIRDDLSLGDLVEMPGEKKPQEVLGLMSRCDLFVLASRRAGLESGVMDGIPVSLMEAMAMQKPVVSCAVSGIPELVEDGETGLLAPPGDEGKLASSILRLLEDEGLRRRVAARGRDRVDEEFNIRKTVARLEEYFRKSVRSPDGSETRKR